MHIENSAEWSAANSDGASQSFAELLGQAAQIAKDSAVESNTLNMKFLVNQILMI